MFGIGSFGARGKTGKARPLRFAGSWYSASPELLERQMQEFQQGACSIADKEQALPVNKDKLLAIVVPHAGYLYSGSCAMVSFLKAKACAPKVKRVILLGPSHYHGFHGVGLSEDKAFATLFGELNLDSEATEKLSRELLFSYENEAHHLEHSLEMQLAFIKREFPQTQLLPLLIGQLESPQEARFIGEKLKECLREGDLIVISSDFTHFGPRFAYTPFGAHDFEKLRRLDLEACSYLTKPDLDKFFSFYKRTGDTICGVYALSILLALLPEDAQGELLQYKNSREVVEEYDGNCVSYMALSFNSAHHWGEHLPDANSQAVKLSAGEKTLLLKIARYSIEHYLETHKAASQEELLKVLEEKSLPRRLHEVCGAFVSLFKVGEGIHVNYGRSLSQGKELRGCIGSILPFKPLYETVVENAIAAAVRDQRFEPLRSSELENLVIEISVLTVPRPISSYEKIRLGVDGVILNKGGRQAVFLPHVATEFGWTREEMLRELSRKAGLAADDWRHGANFQVFQADCAEEGDREVGKSPVQ
jgi:AmmeMemoRadiSam system protein B/AmmeMemoRadiSam system protein A